MIFFLKVGRKAEVLSPNLSCMFIMTGLIVSEADPQVYTLVSGY